MPNFYIILLSVLHMFEWSGRKRDKSPIGWFKSEQHRNSALYFYMGSQDLNVFALRPIPSYCIQVELRPSKDSSPQIEHVPSSERFRIGCGRLNKL